MPSSRPQPWALSTPISDAPSARARRVTPLPISTQTKLRSSLLLPTLPHILSELLHNALDAGTGRVEVWLDAGKEGQSIRVEDDGCGIRREDLGQVGGRWGSSKARSGWNGGQGAYGFRGEALASIASLGLLEIITRPAGSHETLTKVIRGSKVLVEGVSSRSLGRERGTTVIVKDLFHDIPVRQSALAAASSTATVAACKKVIETLALVKPGVKWTIWEEPAISSSTTAQKRILHVHSSKNSVEVFRSVYGTAGVERVQSIRVSSGKKRIDGFISLEGSLTKNHQHLYVNSFPLDRCELHSVITKRFAKSTFSAMAEDGAYDPANSRGPKRTPRRPERYPVYVLNVQIPSAELDASYTPGKTVMGYKDEEGVKSFVLAVVDEFLKRHEFSRPSSERCPAASPRNPGYAPATRGDTFTPRSLARPASTPVAGNMMPPPATPSDRRGRPNSAMSALGGLRPPTQSRIAFAQSMRSSASSGMMKRKVTDRDCRDFELDASGRKRYKWIDEVLAGADTGVLPFTPDHRVGQSHSPTSRPAASSWRDSPTCCSIPIKRLTAIPSVMTYTSSSQVDFSGTDLARAVVLGQVEHKFICATLSSGDTTGKTVVLIDQHAADERVSVEALLKELCEGFMADAIPITELQEPLPAVVLSREEALQLGQDGVRDIFARWGIDLDCSGMALISEVQEGGVAYVQIPVRAVPTVLQTRLSRKEATEMTRLVKLYLPVISAGIGQVGALLRDHPGESGRKDWGEALGWIPGEMLELVNSKACRNAIMFGDKLSKDQCERLVSHLSNTRFPFMCAHGRPSLVPLVSVGEAGSAPYETTGLGKRAVDWGGWKRRYGT